MFVGGFYFGLREFYDIRNVLTDHMEELLMAHTAGQERPTASAQDSPMPWALSKSWGRMHANEYPTLRPCSLFALHNSILDGPVSRNILV
jgi:hypothetical protein